MRHKKVLTAATVLEDSWIECQASSFVVANAAKGRHFRFSPDRACTFGVIGQTSGRRIMVRVEQPVATGFTVTPDSQITGMTALTVSTTAGSVTCLELLWDEHARTWQLLAYLTATQAALLYQPLNSNLTSIAALSTTSFGRNLLTLADQAALLAEAGAAASSHNHNASDINAGTLDVARFSAHADLVAEGKIGTAANQVAQGNHTHVLADVADAGTIASKAVIEANADPAGGVVVDDECRAALSALQAKMRTSGALAT